MLVILRDCSSPCRRPKRNGVSQGQEQIVLFTWNTVNSSHGQLSLPNLGYQASLGAPDTSVEFQRVNSRICVAMMVFAPIYVAQM